ncbi:MAG: hypothetical protein EBR30_01400 [Cytophagia bacterium]|nr:hypothetical protein [Cytophagia bacterium]
MSNMSTKNNPSKLHPEILKMYNSPIYRRKIKKMVEMAKNIKYVQTGKIMGKLPNRAVLKKNPSEKELETFRKENQFKLDKQTIHYFAQTLESGSERRVISGGNNEVAE